MTGRPPSTTGLPTSRTDPAPAPRRIVVRALAAAALLGLLAAPLAGCTDSSSPDTCHDISVRVCDRLAECGSLARTFGTPERCADSFDGLFASQNRTDDECRLEWSLIGDLPCGALVTHFDI
jgi:hypothetical protein